MNPLTNNNPALRIRISLAEIKHLREQASEDIGFLNTIDRFVKEKLFLSGAQIKYLCELAKVDPDRYVYVDID